LQSRNTRVPSTGIIHRATNVIDSHKTTLCMLIENIEFASPSLLPPPFLCKWWGPPDCFTSWPGSFRKCLGSSRTQNDSGLRPLSELYRYHHHHRRRRHHNHSHPHHHLHKIMVARLASTLGYPPRLWYTKPLRRFPFIVSACVDYLGTVF